VTPGFPASEWICLGAGFGRGFVVARVELNRIPPPLGLGLVDFGLTT
jgi:hypothetical protein